MKNITLCCFLGLLVTASAASPRRYYYNRTVSAATSKITVRQATTGARPLTFLGGWVKSSAACTASITKRGTVSGGTAVTPASIPVLDDRSYAATAGITLDGTVSGDTTVISEASTASQVYEGGMAFGAGSTPMQFTMSMVCSGTQTIEQYLEFHEE